MNSVRDKQENDLVEIPIDGVLDLHTFDPRQIKSLVTEYISVCRQKGIVSIRIIHGKGTGQLRKTVHAILKSMPEVVEFKTGDVCSGSWGSTLVSLKPIKIDSNECKH